MLALPPLPENDWVNALALVLDVLGRYRGTVIEKVSGRRVNENPNTFALVNASWEQKPNYMRMVASLDMFLNKFTDHPLSKLRFATVTTRFRDCSALGD